MKNTSKSIDLIPIDWVNLNEIRENSPNMSKLIGDIVVPEVPIFNTDNLMLDYLGIDEAMREIHEQKRRRNQG